MAGKFQIKSRTWNLITIIGSVVLLIVGFGGLFVLQAADAGAAETLVFVVIVGVITFLLFAGPGIVYPARKRIKAIKGKLPGGTLAWIRSHLYLPILALVAAFVHAASVPYRSLLSSGKVLLVVGILVAVAGWCRHHLIGLQKTALNVDITISKIVDGQPRRFRQLAADLVEGRRPVADIEADVAQLGPEQQPVWREVRELSDRVNRHFPRTGGQSTTVRAYKLLRAAHAPLTIALFVLLGFHIWDVFGVTRTVLPDEKSEVATAESCAGCHSEIHDEWQRSSMSHAQTSSITEAQLPITLAENARLVEELGEDQQELFDAAAKSCVNCHAPVGSQFSEQLAGLLPLDEANNVNGGNAAVQSDGVGCVTCHSQEEAPAERAGFGPLPIERGSGLSYGTVYGPVFDDPNPLPQRVHDIDDDETMWNDPLRSSELCGACHNVAVDIDGDGLSPVDGAEQGLDSDAALNDEDDNNILDQNELDFGDDDVPDDLVLQTTYDEWQDYVVTFDEVFDEGAPLGCTGCHMPTEGDGEGAVVDAAPGLMPQPERPRREHSFVGVDYDLEDGAYESDAALQEALAEREALLGSAVTLEVENVNGDQVAGDVFTANVRVNNNLLAHNFPTGFAFARQFWLEVTAVDEDGNELCTVDLDFGEEQPCGSGVIENDGQDLPQCDPDITGFGGDFGNADFELQGLVENCDPWLANFQKILTDGDPDEDGVLTEVPYQSFLGGIVRDRFRAADNLQMTALNPTRLNAEGEDQTSIDIPYDFDTSEIADGVDVTVTARLRFRHLPPYFIRDLAERQQDIEVPDGARIDDPDEFIENLVVTDVVTSSSGQGPVLACPGPQNDPSASILDCIG